MSVKILGLLGAVALAASAQANIVTNGDFENNGLTSWTSQGWSTNITGVISGAYSASTGCVGDGCIHDSTGAVNGSAYLYQDLATVVGGIYNLDFDFGAQGFTNELAVTFGGVTVFDGVNLPSDNLHYSVTGLAATGTTTRLSFFGRQDPSFNRLDNIVVEQAGVSAAPEPASWAMMVGGFGLIGFAMRSRRNLNVRFV